MSAGIRKELAVQRLFAIAGILCLALVSSGRAADAKDCLDVSGSQDRDVSSPSGVQVTVTGHNHCSDSVNSGQVWFTVKALGNGAVLGSQRGHFGPTVSAQGQVETKVFVTCQPDRVSSISVEKD